MKLTCNQGTTMANRKLPSFLSAHAKNQYNEVDKSFQRYAIEWKMSSEFHQHEGDYDWMASQLPEVGFTFEIGTGSGLSTLALLRAGNRVLGLDQNIYMLQVAKKRLEDEGLSAELIERLDFKPLGSGGAILNYRHVDLSFESTSEKICLLEGDIEQVDFRGDWTKSKDSSILKMLKSFKFDAVTLWLPGTGLPFPAKPTKELPGILIVKIHLVRNAFEMAHKLLRAGGLLQIVDRIDPEGAPDDLHQLYRRYDLGFTRFGSSERITSLDTYSGVTLSQSNKTSDSPAATEIKLISMLYQKPALKAD